VVSQTRLPSETIEHLLCECPNTKTIWLLLKEWLDSINIKIPSMTIKTAILGDILQSKAVNHIILITKYYIYLSKITQLKPIFKNLLLAIIKA
jgi:hypothetical protein